MNKDFEEMTSIYEEAAMNNSLANGEAFSAPLDRFKEDPQNARKVFDQEELELLGQSILERGVIEPISVVRNREKPGYFIVAGGNRRLRASRLAGMKDIPYVLRKTTDSLERIALNQHSKLGVMELSEALNREKDAGMKAKDIAKVLGKSYDWVSKYLAVAKFAAPILDLINSGVTDMKFLLTLHANYKREPEYVEEFIEGGTHTTNGWKTWLEDHHMPGLEKKEEAVRADPAPDDSAITRDPAEGLTKKAEGVRDEDEADQPGIPPLGNTAQVELPRVPDLDAGMIFIGGRKAVEFKRGDRVEIVFGDRRWDIEVGE